MFLDQEATQHRFTMNKHLSVVFILMVVAVPTMCHRLIRSSDVKPPDEDTIYLINQMSTNLIDILVKNVKSNFASSPLGVGELLALASISSSGKTEKEVMRAMQVRGSNYLNFYKIIHNYIKQYTKKNNNFQLNIANAIVRKPKVLESYSFPLSTKTFSDFTSIKLESEGHHVTADIMNLWLKNVTNDSFNYLIGETMYKNLKLMLVNVMYLSGSWTLPFDKQLTKVRPFQLSIGSKNIPTMHQTVNINYSELTDFKINAKFIQLPYKTQDDVKQVSMFIIVPFGSGSFLDIELNMRRITVDRLYKSRVENVDVYLPKFKLDLTLDLNEHLIEMGVADAFTDKADFSKIDSENSLSLSRVLQKIYIEVNEEGSSKINDSPEGTYEREIKYNPDSSKEFIADQQFLVIIANRDFIFFTGQVSNPTIKSFQPITTRI